MKSVDIPYQEFTLANGLRVIVHTDRKAPIVALSVWYNVGSKFEPAGKTGFAHLFEHLMFNGSENAPGDYFGPMKEVGATDLNGTTWFDRTNYFETVPTPALERALFLESDRMGYLPGAVTQGVLDEQRGVVQNEKRQGDNQPYGLVEYSQLAALFPEGHPYRHSTIGSMADLDARQPRHGEGLVPRPLCARTTRSWCWRAISTPPRRSRWSRNISARSRGARECGAQGRRSGRSPPPRPR